MCAVYNNFARFIDFNLSSDTHTIITRFLELFTESKLCNLDISIKWSFNGNYWFSAQVTALARIYDIFLFLIYMSKSISIHRKFTIIRCIYQAHLPITIRHRRILNIKGGCDESGEVFLYDECSHMRALNKRSIQ